jgi:hypothetical protein
MRAIRLLGVLAGLSFCTNIGWTCCLAFNVSNPMSLVDEKAIIVWDPERKLEHFVRQASFEGEAMDFGFIVPAPSEPKVAEAKGEAFDGLEVFVSKEMGGDSATTGFAGMDSAAEPAGSVEVIDQYLVGDFEVSILKATDGKSMLDWLRENNYDSRPAMEDWLDHYAKMGWYFAALKFVRPEDAQSPQTSAVRVSFTTDVPFYPYKMPEDTWPKGHVRPIALYFVSGGIARGQYRGSSKDWEAEVKWSGDLPREEAMTLATNIGLTADDIPEAATLTAFHNTENAQGYDQDLFFLTYRSILPTWAVLLVLALVTGGIVYLIVTRRKGAAATT